MPTTIIPRVVLNLEPLLSGPQSQPAIRFNLEGQNFPVVHIPGLGRVPALVAIRLVLTKVTDNAQYWALWAAPYEPGLLTRLLGCPSGQIHDVSYQITALLKEALKPFAVLEPPEGTVVQATFTFTSGGVPRWDWYVSTIEGATRRYEAARRHNEHVLAGSFGYGWLRRLWSWGLVDVPDKPGEDRWATEHRPELDSTAAEHLFTILQSLWKAVFAEGKASTELKAVGFNMGAIGQTQLGSKGLRKVVAEARDRALTRITMHG